MSETDILDVVDRLYAAALEPDQWPDALTAVARATGGMGTAMLPVTPVTNPVLVISPELREAGEDYERDWWRIDPTLAVARRRGLSAGVWTDDESFVPTPPAITAVRRSSLPGHNL